MCSKRQPRNKMNIDASHNYVIVQFSDGMQVIPNTWLSCDLKTARWPNFTSNARYNRAVKDREAWEEDWIEHPLKRILGTAHEYDKARKKLKAAEVLSDLNSGSDVDDRLKSTRKNRARKIVSNDEADDVSEDETYYKLPPFPKLSTDTPRYMFQTQDNDRDEASAEEVNDDTGHISNSLSYDNSFRSTRNTSSSVRQSQSKKKLPPAGIDSSEADKENYSTEPKTRQQPAPHILTDNNHSFLHRENTSNNNVISLKKTKSKQKPAHVMTEHKGTDGVDEIRDNETNGMEQLPFQRFVVQRLIDVRYKMRVLEENQNGIINKLNQLLGAEVSRHAPERVEEDEDENESTDFEQPLRTLEELDEVNKKLAENSKFRKELIKKLVSIGGRNLKTFCLNVMGHLFSNELAEQFSWVGAKGKKAFGDLKICKIILRAIRRTYPQATDETISAPIKIWLAHAKERMQKRTVQE